MNVRIPNMVLRRILRSLRPSRAEAGVSLPEVMVAVAVLSMIMAGVSQFMGQTNKNVTALNQTTHRERLLDKLHRAASSELALKKSATATAAAGLQGCITGGGCTGALPSTNGIMAGADTQAELRDVFESNGTAFDLVDAGGTTVAGANVFYTLDGQRATKDGVSCGSASRRCPLRAEVKYIPVCQGAAPCVQAQSLIVMYRLRQVVNVTGNDAKFKVGNATASELYWHVNYALVEVGTVNNEFDDVCPAGFFSFGRDDQGNERCGRIAGQCGANEVQIGESSTRIEFDGTNTNTSGVGTKLCYLPPASQCPAGQIQVGVLQGRARQPECAPITACPAGQASLGSLSGSGASRSAVCYQVTATCGNFGVQVGRDGNRNLICRATCPAGTEQVGSNASGNPICWNSVSTCSNTSFQVGRNSAGLICAPRARFCAVNQNLKYIDQFGNPVCSTEATGCPAGQKMMGKDNWGNAICAWNDNWQQCPAGQKQIGVNPNGSIQCGWNNPGQYCPTGQVASGINWNGSPICENLDRACWQVVTQAPNCGANGYLREFNKGVCTPQCQTTCEKKGPCNTTCWESCSVQPYGICCRR